MPCRSVLSSLAALSYSLETPHSPLPQNSTRAAAAAPCAYRSFRPHDAPKIGVTIPWLQGSRGHICAFSAQRSPSGRTGEFPLAGGPWRPLRWPGMTRGCGERSRRWWRHPASHLRRAGRSLGSPPVVGCPLPGWSSEGMRPPAHQSPSAPAGCYASTCGVRTVDQHLACVVILLVKLVP